VVEENVSPDERLATGMDILVRMPNWLGDAVMATGFLDRLKEVYPSSRVHAIVREELGDFVRILTQVSVVHSCRRDDLSSPLKALRLARRISVNGGFEQFYCLPPSFSSAFMGFFTRSRQRIGYRGQWRSWALTHAYEKPAGMHRAATYAHLLHERVPNAAGGLRVSLTPDAAHACPELIGSARPVIGLNINSEAPSRRLSPARGAVIADALADAFDCTVALVGSRAQAGRTAALAAAMRRRERCVDLAGKTTLPELAWLLARLDAFVSVDSGPAHLANAVGTMTVVLFGAGDETITAPWNAARLRVVRADGLPCRMCGRNDCRLGMPICLESIPVEAIVVAVRCRPGNPRL
jgi:heptosyltransferase II